MSIGLIPSGEREGTGQHYYTEEYLERLRKIDQLKKLGLSLDEIREVVQLYFIDPSGVQSKRKALAILRQHMSETDHYETVGQGPVLILIPGANGTGDIFASVTKFLQDKYTVVTYDRRSYRNSELTEPLPEDAKNTHSTYRLETDANDVAALAKHLSDEPVNILGSSSGALSLWKPCKIILILLKKLLSTNH